MAKKSVGAPPIFQNVEDMQKKIDNYFKYCEGRPLLDSEGEPIITKSGQAVMIDQHPPTVTGLAYFLGFTSRQALLNYQAKDEFVDAVTRAKMLIEVYTNERLYDKEGHQGAKFSLTNNFKGYTDKQIIESKNININADLTEEDADKILKEQGILIEDRKSRLKAIAKN